MSASELLEEIHRLLELKGENPFKVRAYERAAEAVSGHDDLVERARQGTLTEIPGVGKGIAEVLTEFLLKGTSSARDELAESLPPGLLELTRVPGLGPKKARQLIEELEIRNVRELEYACRENRLLKLKGFGEKLQSKILEGIRFLDSHSGQARWVDALPSVETLRSELLKAIHDGRHPAAQGLRVCECGAFRRRLEILSGLDFLIELPEGEKASAGVRRCAEKALEGFRAQHGGLLPVQLHFSVAGRFGFELARLSGSEAHWRALGEPLLSEASTEEEFYGSMGLPMIPPEMRETGEEVRLARAGKLDSILPWNGIKGVFHNHTTRSDGAASLEEMVLAAKRLGYEYIGISDHSQSAFYAHGLKVPDLLEQEREVKELQQRHPEIRIFWGIESDILADGSLDYETSVLKKFDFVIASIHSRFKMDRDAMTERVLTAIRNPYTRFLGHATGRLLLGRPGYDLDMEAVIAESAKRGVAIEINANPARLDIDWRWGPALRASGTEVSVNPDAHDTAGLKDTEYGVAVARKALLPSRLVVNARNATEVRKWLERS